jgi:hypothetical protein
VVVGGGLTVSTRRKSVPQALPDTRRRTTSIRRRDEPRDMRWRWGPSAVMSTGDGSGSGSATGGPRGGVGFRANAATRGGRP